MDEAACLGYPDDYFFPDTPGIHGAKQKERAKAVCLACPVIEKCRVYREATDSGYGVWAGEAYRTNSVSEGGPRRRSA